MLYPIKKLSIYPFIFLILLFSPSPSNAIDSGGQVGQAPHDFTLISINGKSYSLNEYKGKKAVLVVFWATWCPNCKKEIPKLKEIYNKYSKKGLLLLAINLGMNDSEQKTVRYRDKYELPYPVLFDREQKTAKAFNIMGVPTFIIIDINGIIRYRSAAAPENLGEHLVELMKKKS